MTRTPDRRQGVAATELAVILPFLLLLFFISVDFSRIYWFTTVASFMARDGAMFAAANDDTTTPTYTNTTAIAAAAAKDDSFASSNPFTVTSAVTGTAGTSSHVVTVTVSHTFTTIVSYPGMPTSFAYSRSCQMRIGQNVPDD